MFTLGIDPVSTWMSTPGIISACFTAYVSQIHSRQSEKQLVLNLLIFLSLVSIYLTYLTFNVVLF